MVRANPRPVKLVVLFRGLTAEATCLFGEFAQQSLGADSSSAQEMKAASVARSSVMLGSTKRLRWLRSGEQVSQRPSVAHGCCPSCAGRVRSCLSRGTPRGEIRPAVKAARSAPEGLGLAAGRPSCSNTVTWTAPAVGMRRALIALGPSEQVE
jgi:hypothetical protein